jgi:hypothetical protein
MCNNENGKLTTQIEAMRYDLEDALNTRGNEARGRQCLK